VDAAGAEPGLIAGKKSNHGGDFFGQAITAKRDQPLERLARLVRRARWDALFERLDHAALNRCRTDRVDPNIVAPDFYGNTFNHATHTMVCDAIIAGDQGTAREWMRKHIVDFKRGYEMADLNIDDPVALVRAPASDT